MFVIDTWYFLLSLLFTALKCFGQSTN